jgi:hypothetical protein
VGAGPGGFVPDRPELVPCRNLACVCSPTPDRHDRGRTIRRAQREDCCLLPVCRPLTSVLTGNARPDGSRREAGDRATLRKVLADPRVSGIVVEHRDRLARFGVEHLQAALAASRWWICHSPPSTAVATAPSMTV